MPIYLGNTLVGGVRTSVLGDSVLYTEQTLTEEQKAQARENIGAVSEDEVNINNLAASKVLFEDGETFQQKYDNGELKGQDGIIGKDGAQGPAGADGYTPVKGTDYFTAADKQELVNEFIGNMPVASDTTIGGVKVDTSISETSINPVQNKVIKSYVDAAVAGVVESAPETLNTLNELAAALGDDPNFATTIATQIGNKLDKTGNAATATTATNATNIYSTESTSKAYVLGTTTIGSSNKATVYNSSVYTSGSVLYGAAWNDYAEYREGIDTFEPGRVVCENGNDTLSLATERLQPGAEIVSDTFGFAIGETEKCKTPIAVSGRVLAYPYEDRYSYKPGDAVCAAPGGTVSKMTREEIREYPERIVGTVSAIPEYETWGEGNVSVNGRIWIKVK